MQPLCLGTDQNEGSWVEVPAAEPGAVPPCCGLHATDPAYRRNFSVYGSALCVTSARDFAEDHGRGCTCSKLKRSYEWRPRTCRLVDWSSAHFCALLGSRRRVLLVGDSTMHQAFVTLHNYVRWGARSSRVGRQNKAWGTDCAARIAYWSSDTLIGESYGTVLGGMNRGETLTNALANVTALQAAEGSPPPLVLLSAGAHIKLEPGDTHGFSHAWSMDAQHAQKTPFDLLISKVATVLRPFRDRAMLVWKIQNPAGCGASVLDRLPYDGHANSTFWRAQIRKGTHAPWQWPYFGTMDASAARALRGIASVLDTTPISLRADAHISSPGTGGAGFRKKHDCLHLCHGSADGGPLGLLPRLLLHALVTRQIKLHAPSAGERLLRNASS